LRGTRFEVDLTAIKNNLNVIQSKLNGKTKILAIVKADAYGLGAVAVSRHISETVWAFGVATLEEAIELRENNIRKQIIMLSPFCENEIDNIINNKITPTIVDFKRAEILSKYARKNNATVNVHIKIDTGMGRLGNYYDCCLEEIEKINNLENINIEGIFSHFPSADLLDDDFCNLQIERFDSVIEKLSAKGIDIPVKHLANSSATVAYPLSHKDAVRPGLLMYGAYPSRSIQEIVNVTPSVSFIAKIIFIKTVKEGEGVSYGRTFISQRDSRIAVLGAGYADGYSTLNSSKSFVYIKGKYAPVIGRVCMDYTMVDITELPEVQLGDDAVLFGKGGESVEHYSKRIGIITYEALNSVGKRVPRIHIQ